jgi:A/G-specific adenine glycosylase
MIVTDPSQILDLPRRDALATDLLAWFATVKRDLPWRQEAGLYGIWISEIMLQQTTVQTVIPYWHRFMARFGNVADLAAAEQSEVLNLWTGLGYYSRARNLHAAARMICAEGGDLPRTRDQWLALPGVGPYAAGAIASIGLGEAVPALDANARRVLLRWAVTDPEALASLSTGARHRLVDALGAELVPSDSPGAWNEALMELGALICGARRTDCLACPVRSHCHAWTGQWIDEVPPPAPSTAAERVWAGLLLVSWRDRLLLVPPSAPPVPCLVRRRKVARADFGGLLQGLWGLPMTQWLAGQDDPRLAEASLRAWLDLPDELYLPTSRFACRGHFRHGITKYRLKVAVLQVSLDPRQELPADRVGERYDPAPSQAPATGLFFRRDGARPPLSKLTEKALHFQIDTVV